MRHPLLSAVAATSLLSLAAVAVPSGTAQADVDCSPVIDTSSIDLSPTRLAVTATGYRVQQFSAAFTAPCADDDGSDLEAVVIYSSPDIDGTSLLRASDGISPARGPHAFSVFGSQPILSGDLQNSFAGTWTTEVVVSDNDDDPVHSYDNETGPVMQVLRAARVTANATPEPVAKGKKVTVTGTLTRADWDTHKNGAYAKRAVKLQFRTKTGTYVTVKTVTSSTSGKLTATVKATKDGYVRFAFVGSSTTARAVSKGDYVNVE